MDHAIKTSSLTKKYKEFSAVDHLNLDIKEGEIYGLLGPNGAGKTTTIKILCGLIKPTEGEARLFGKKVPDKKLAPIMGYMPQETALYVGLTVAQNLEFYGNIFGLKTNVIKDRINEILDFIQLKEWENELVGNLSGGMKHRVSLGCTLMHRPKILFLDEPTVGVDPELRVSFWDYFESLKTQGVTILITTHYMDEARHCDRIGFMRKGKKIAEGNPSELLQLTNTNSLEDAFLVFSEEKVIP
jgi:ABC-2 type transport system ATP-binding protein